MKKHFLDELPHFLYSLVLILLVAFLAISYIHYLETGTRYSKYKEEKEEPIYIATPEPTEVVTPKPSISTKVKYIPPIKKNKAIISNDRGNNYYSVKPNQFSDYEIRLVASLIYREAPGSTSIGHKAIASIVLNRVMNESRWFPDSVSGVIFQHNQFTGHTREKLESCHPNKSAIEAAYYVFRDYGSILPKKVMFYRANSSNKNRQWYDYLRYYGIIEGNNFYETTKYF